MTDLRPTPLSMIAPLGILLCLGSSVATAGAAPLLEPSVDRGRTLTLRICAGCHAVGPGAESPNSGAPAFSSIRLRYNALSLARRLEQLGERGHGEMAPVALSDAEIQDIVDYMESVELRPRRPPSDP